MKRRLLFALLLAVPALSIAAPPKPYTAEYEVRYDGTIQMHGTATITFAALGDDRYELHTSLTAIAGISRDERSTIRWTGDQTETIDYAFRQQMGWKKRERSVHVDAAAGRVASTDKSHAYSIRYQPGVLDQQAVTAALMQDVGAKKTGDLVYAVVKRGDLESQRYRQSATEQLTTAIGEQRAIRVERVRESAGGRNTTIWLGVDQNYVPLKLLQTEADGETTELLIKSIR